MTPEFNCPLPTPENPYANLPLGKAAPCSKSRKQLLAKALAPQALQLFRLGFTRREITCRMGKEHGRGLPYGEIFKAAGCLF